MIIASIIKPHNYSGKYVILVRTDNLGSYFVKGKTFQVESSTYFNEINILGIQKLNNPDKLVLELGKDFNENLIGCNIVVEDSQNIENLHENSHKGSQGNSHDSSRENSYDGSQGNSPKNPVETNEWYIHDLVHFSVKYNNSIIGKVVGILRNSAQDILEIKLLNKNTQTVKIPFIKKFVPIVDEKNKEITITPIDGLL